MPGNDVIHPICDRWGRLRNFDFCAIEEPTRTWPYMLWINPQEQAIQVRDAANDDWIAVGGGNGGGGAPVDAQYLVLALDGDLSAERRFVPGDGLQATDAGPNGDYTLNIDVSDFAGDGLEDDGAENLQVDATVVRTSGDQTIAGVKIFQGNIILDDGVGDSPQLRFVGGSHDDTALIFLEDDAQAGKSDLVIKLPGNSDDSVLSIRASDDTELVNIKRGASDYVSVDGPLLATVISASAGLTAMLVSAGGPVGYFQLTTNKTSTVESVWDLVHLGGTVTAGFGARLRYQLEDGAGNQDNAAFIDAGWSNASHGSEASYLAFGVRIGGAEPVEVCRMDGTGMVTPGDIYPENSTCGLHARFEDIFGDDAPATLTDFVRYAPLALGDVPVSNIAGFVTNTSVGSDSYIPTSPFSKSNTGTVYFYVQSHHLRINSLAGTASLIWSNATAKANCELYLQFMARAGVTYGGEIRGWAVETPGAGDAYWAVRFKYDPTTYPQWPWRAQLYSGTGTTFAVADGTLRQDSPWDPFNAMYLLFAAQAGPTCAVRIGGYHSQIGIEILKQTVASMPTTWKRIQVYVATSYQEATLDSMRMY